MRLGPMRLAYEGEVRIDERDDAALRAVMAGNAREARGGGSASARIAMRVEPVAEPASRVVAEADVVLSGRAAQMGKGIVEDVARRLVGEMAGCLEAGLAAPAPRRAHRRRPSPPRPRSRCGAGAWSSGSPATACATRASPGRGGRARAAAGGSDGVSPKEAQCVSRASP